MQPIHRRRFLKQTGAAAALAAFGPSHSSAAAAPVLTTPAEIEKRVREARPLLGGRIPADLKYRLGMNVAKFWLREDELPGYGYNSDWSPALKSGRLVDVLKHNYYVEALSQPFRTVLLEVFPLVGNKQTFFSGENDFANEEDQFHEVAAYLTMLLEHAGKTLPDELRKSRGS